MPDPTRWLCYFAESTRPTGQPKFLTCDSSRTASTDFCLHRLFYSVFDFFLIFRFWAVRKIKLAISSAFERTLIYRVSCRIVTNSRVA